MIHKMNDLQLGKMYLAKEYFWLLYPTKEVVVWGEGSWPSSSGAYRYAKEYSECYNCNVGVVEPNTYVVLLEHDKAYFKFLDSNGNVGWICCRDFSKYFELVKE